MRCQVPPRPAPAPAKPGQEPQRIPPAKTARPARRRRAAPHHLPRPDRPQPPAPTPYISATSLPGGYQPAHTSRRLACTATTARSLTFSPEVIPGIAHRVLPRRRSIRSPSAMLNTAMPSLRTTSAVRFSNPATPRRQHRRTGRAHQHVPAGAGPRPAGLGDSGPQAPEVIGRQHYIGGLQHDAGTPSCPWRPQHRRGQGWGVTDAQQGANSS
jgi:hypothetical protein